MAEITISQPQFLKLGVIGLLTSVKDKLIDESTIDELIALADTIDPLNPEEVKAFFKFIQNVSEDHINEFPIGHIPETVKHLTTAGYHYRVFKEVDNNGDTPFGMFFANVYDATGKLVGTKVALTIEQLQEDIRGEYPMATREGV